MSPAPSASAPATPAPSLWYRGRELALWWGGAALVVLVWAVAARSQPEYSLPSPGVTWRALLTLFREDALLPALGLTLGRAVSGLGLACAVGLPLGWMMGTWTWLRQLLASWVQTLMAVPPIVLVVVGMIWLGPTAGVVVLVVTLVTTPLLVTTVRDAVAGVDHDLLDMAQVFAKGPWWTVRRVVLPAVLPPALSAVTVALGQSVRVTVMAELLSTSTGLGAEIQQARVNLETADVFAASALMAVLTMVLELLLLQPLRRRLALRS